jgi:hypothetical protein
LAVLLADEAVGGARAEGRIAAAFANPPESRPHRQIRGYDPAVCAGGTNMTGGLLSPADAPGSGRGTKILSPRSWTGSEAGNVCHPFVILDKRLGKYRMYYSVAGATQTNESVWDRWAIGIATSADTAHWAFPEDHQPILFGRRFREGEVLESSDLRRTFDSVFALNPSVVGGATYEMWYAGWSGDTEPIGGGRVRHINYRIGHAVSADGLAWTKQPGPAGGGAVIGLGGAGAPDSRGAADPFVIKEGGVYRMWYAGYDGEVWRICTASSLDGQLWTKQGIALGPGGDALDELGLRSPVVIRRNGGYELWYQGRSRSVPAFHVRRATGPDGNSWKKLPAELALHPDRPVEGEEEIHVGSLRLRPNGTVQVFFAKQTTAWREAAFGRVPRKSFSIYSETVNP